MNEKDLLDDLYENRSNFFPSSPALNEMHMDLNGKIYMFLENCWAEVEDIQIELNDDRDERFFSNISHILGIEL